MSKDIETKTVELLDKLDALTTQYTPEVIDGAVTAVTVTAIGELVYGLLGLVACYGLWWLTTHATEYCRNKKDEGGWGSDWEIPWCVSWVIGGIVCGAFATNSIWALFNVWNWVAIFNPELAMAHRVLGL
jgi:hypothetical protein